MVVPELAVLKKVNEDVRKRRLNVLGHGRSTTLPMTTAKLLIQSTYEMHGMRQPRSDSAPRWASQDDQPT
jgi:hypothetical protein